MAYFRSQERRRLIAFALVVGILLWLLVNEPPKQAANIIDLELRRAG